MNVLGPGPSISDIGKMKLIDYVRVEGSIWNPNCPEYSKPDLKVESWTRVQNQMKQDGFDFTLTFLRRVWNNLLVYWKKINHYNKKPAGKEWPFGKSMTFLSSRYGPDYVVTRRRRRRRGEEPSNEESSEEKEEEEEDDFDLSDDDWRLGTSVDKHPLLDDDVSAEPESETSTAREHGRKDDSNVTRSGSGENSKGSGINGNQRRRSHGEDDSTEDIPAKRSREEPEEDRPSQSDPERRRALANDRIDKYAAFLASTLREMPEKESKQKMKEMMFLLLEDMDCFD
ncbi:hypothetical protein Q1695_004308 [Nippostrongylus brasiliensis]|nr:hypothetical protein Q1695_004308 [Nippostrongylus brasiliensis]